MTEPQDAALILTERLEAQRFPDLAGRAVPLDDPEVIWIVLEGRMDVQAVPLRDSVVSGMGRHVMEVLPGGLVPGTAPVPMQELAGDVVAFRGRCASGTVLARTSRTRLRALRLDLEALVAIERWTEALAAATTPQPRTLSTNLAEADPEQTFPAGSVLFAPHDSIVWVTVEAGTIHPLGEARLALVPGDPAFPLTAANWITLPAKAVVTGQLTPARMRSAAIWEDMEAFGRIALGHMGAELRDATRDGVSRQARRAAWTRARFDDSLFRLGRAADETLQMPAPAPANAADDWSEAFALVASASGIALPGAGPHNTDLEQAALNAGVAYRSVKLVGDWWRADQGPLLGFMQGTDQEERAVALLPDGPGRYRAYRRKADPGVAVDAGLAGSLGPTAVMLYRPLPQAVRTLPAMLRFGAYGLRPDLLMVVTMGLLSGILGLLTPIASGILMQDVLPQADVALHVAVIAGLAGAALGNAAFSLVQSVAVARVQARIDLSAEAAVWNRLLRLRTAFFRQHSTGDLAERAMGVSEIRRAVTGAATSSLLSGLFSLLSGVLLFWYSPRLAIIAMAFTAFVIVVELALFAIELPRQRRVAAVAGRVETVSFETLSAMPKLRAAAAEPRAFERWSTAFAHSARLKRGAAAMANWRDVLMGIFPLIGTGIIWAGAVGALGGTEDELPVLSLGAFVAFNAAFGNFINGILNLVLAGEAIIGVAPIWERLLPIILAPQETGVGREAMATVRGEITVSNVTFGYETGMPAALDNVSLSFAPGDYVAIVGPSGSGKSTLIRLILGLETPSAGAVYMDGIDLADIDMAAMRRQIGVVMQSGQLASGSILENILGSAPLPESAAWEAAQQAGLAHDIREMPMRMQTMVSEGGGGLSGGQRQRLLIARALVRKPRVLIFDEATSALDNATQAEVKTSLDRLNVTRIVVAHRLTTVRDVHQIIVMDRGRIVEQGTYDGLMAQGGLFARLASRQVA